MRYLAADVGGTFTDLVLVDGSAGAARVFIDKVPSQATGSAAGGFWAVSLVISTTAPSPLY